MNIEEMLKTYLENKARIKFRELDIDGLKEKLRFKGALNIESQEAAIEGLSMSAKSISDMPVPKTNKFHSSTEDAAFAYRDEVIYINDFDPEYIKSKIALIEIELEPLRKEIQQVDIFLDGLTDREKYVAMKFYIHSWTWEEVTRFYNESMPVPRYKTALKDIRDKLMIKIQRISMD